MKKDYNLMIEDSNFVLKNISNPQEQFSISSTKLQFDTRKFYEAIFADTAEHIEITVTKDLSMENIQDPKLSKLASHVFDTITSIINQVCVKLNEECYDNV
jgi:hypothetical protein